MIFDHETLNWLYNNQLGVDERWSVRTPRGFTWWADRNAQTIEVVGAEVAPGLPAAHYVSVSTDLVHGFAPTDHNLEILNTLLMSFAAMSGPVYEPAGKTLKLCSMVLVHEDILGWMNPLISVAAITQIAEARIMGALVAEALGGKETLSGPPGQGLRPVPDDLAEAVALVIAPQGQQPCRWREREFQETVDRYMNKPPSLGGTAGGLGLTVEFPFGNESSLCRMRGVEPHPRYGNGLFLLQSFPVRGFSEPEGIRLALSLNAMELTRKSMGYGFGSYAFQDEMLHFTGFLPNAIYRPGLLPNLYFACGSRAREMSVRLARQDWKPESFDLGHSALGRLMSQLAPERSHDHEA